MRHIISIVLSISVLFGFGECAKVPLEVAVDFSKKGTVYETDFQAPWNIWGSLVEFYILVRTPDVRFASDEERGIRNYILNGHPHKSTPRIKMKITLSPLGRASENITVILDSKEWRNRKEKHYTEGQKIEEIVSVPLYGDGYGKRLIIADLQRLRNYHVRVESLENIELPKEVSTYFIINKFSTKH